MLDMRRKVLLLVQIFALWAALEGWYYGFQTGHGLAKFSFFCSRREIAIRDRL